MEKNNKKKILMTAISMGIGGNETFIVNVLKSIDRSKFDIDVYCYDGTRMEHAKEVLALGSQIFVSNVKQKGKWKIIWEMVAMYRFLKKNHYDIIHCNECSLKGLLKGTVGAKLYGKSIVISHSHGVGGATGTIPDSFIRNILRRILQWSIDYGLACSDSAGQSKYTKKFRKTERYRIFRNAVDTSIFLFDEQARKEIRNKFYISNELVIGNVGRLSPEKNQAVLLEILKEVRRKNEETYLMIVGGGELYSELKSMAERMGILENVILVGEVSDVNKYYSAMDVLVMPSKYEGMPFTVVEAQVNGLKCVMSDTITRMADITGDNIFLTLDDGIQKWANEILKLGKERISSKKVKKVITDYELENEIKRLEDLYSEVKLEKSNPPSSHLFEN